MKAHGFDPFRLDVQAFAKGAGELDGDWPLRDLARLAEAASSEAAPALANRVHWHARGESRPVRAGSAQVWLHLEAEAQVALQCQRCLQAVPSRLSAKRSFLFVHGETAAAQLDAESEHDVLALTHALDLQVLTEDELLLTLPLVPLHEHCETPQALASADEAASAAPPNPFAALATLRGRTRPN